MAGWSPMVVTQLVGDPLAIEFLTVQDLERPEVAREWIGYTGLRILGALLLGLAAALFAARKLESPEGRRIVLTTLGWASGLTLLMTLAQVQAILSVFSALTWLLPLTAALMLSHSLLLLRAQRT